MYDVRFQTPFTCIISGASSSGKTWLCNNILKNKNSMFSVPPARTFLFYEEDQDLYHSMLETGAIDEMHQGMPSLETLREMLVPYKKSGGSCCIFDDSMHNVHNEISKLFTTHSHHLNSSMFFITQNLFVQNKEYRTMSLNATYVIIMAGARSRRQVDYFAKQVALYKTAYIVDAFLDMTQQPYSYLLFDFKASTPHHLMVRSHILPHEAPMRVYLEKSKRI